MPGNRSALSALLTSAALAAALCTGASAQTQGEISNGGFEQGDASSWLVQDLSLSLMSVRVVPEGQTVAIPGFFTSAPTEGDFALVHGFDGSGPGAIRLSREVGIPSQGLSTLRFDTRGGWDLTAVSATQDRSFRVLIRNTPFSPPIASYTVLIARSGTKVVDTGNVSPSLSLRKYRGTSIVIEFAWDVPQNFSGPGFFQLDNVHLAPTADLKGVRLRAKLNTGDPDRDALKLTLPVRVPTAALPDGTELRLVLGEAETVFVLDHAERAVTDTHVVQLKRVKGDPLARRLKLRAKRVSLVDDFARFGVLDADKSPGAPLPSLPIHVTVGDEVSSTVLAVKYRASKGPRGRVVSVR